MAPWSVGVDALVRARVGASIDSLNVFPLFPPACVLCGRALRNISIGFCGRRSSSSKTTAGHSLSRSRMTCRRFPSVAAHSLPRDQRTACSVADIVVTDCVVQLLTGRAENALRGAALLACSTR
jgi:hypothetical protein